MEAAGSNMARASENSQSNAYIYVEVGSVSRQKRKKGLEAISYSTQSELTVENGLFRPKPKSGFSYTTEKDFSIKLFRLNFPTGESSRRSRFFRLDLLVEKLSQKKNHVCFEPIASLVPPPHTHTPTHPYQVPHSSIIQQRRSWLD